MERAELAFFTTAELVKELTRRTTFLGVVVHAETDLKDHWAGERTFCVSFNSNLSAGEVRRLLDVVSANLEART
jgi:hypothetical protein